MYHEIVIITDCLTPQDKVSDFLELFYCFV